jgi:hypothetical protein
VPAGADHPPGRLAGNGEPGRIDSEQGADQIIDATKLILCEPLVGYAQVLGVVRLYDQAVNKATDLDRVMRDTVQSLPIRAAVLRDLILR